MVRTDIKMQPFRERKQDSHLQCDRQTNRNEVVVENNERDYCEKEALWFAT